MSDEADWLEVYQDSSELMRNVASDLEIMAEKMWYVAPESMIVKGLSLCAKDLRSQASKLDDATQNKLSSDLKQSFETSGNLLMASIAGVFCAESTRNAQNHESLRKFAEATLKDVEDTNPNRNN